MAKNILKESKKCTNLLEKWVLLSPWKHCVVPYVSYVPAVSVNAVLLFSLSLGQQLKLSF